MRTDRRGFFRALGGALALLGFRSGTPAAEAAPAIHRATRNTKIGARGPKRPRPEGPPAKPYPERPRVALPAPAAGDASPLATLVRGYARTPAFAGDPISLALASRLLHFANGVTGRETGTALRAAPSAGALYAGEVYLVAERVEGLEPGVYSYEVAEHRLVRLRSGPLLARVAGAVERASEVEGAAAAVLLTNVFRRYTWRYRNRGYRYALIDSGHIGENLRLTARSAGLAETAPLRFEDDALNALLGVDGRREAVCAVHAVGRAGAGEPGPTRRLVERQHLEPDRIAPLRPLTRRYHEATKLVASRAAAPTGSPAPARRSRATDLRLPASDREASAEAAIAARRSALRFETEPIDADRLGFVLEMARGPEALARAPGVELVVAAHRVRDVAPGIYRYEPGAAGLSLQRPGDASRALVEACVGQEKVGRAAAACLMVARFADEPSPLGGRSYRDQLLEAGAIGQRVYLAAEAAGLAARNLAAFFDDELDALLGLAPGAQAVVHLTAFGPEG